MVNKVQRVSRGTYRGLRTLKSLRGTESESHPHSSEDGGGSLEMGAVRVDGAQHAGAGGVARSATTAFHQAGPIGAQAASYHQGGGAGGATNGTAAYPGGKHVQEEPTPRRITLVPSARTPLLHNSRNYSQTDGDVFD